MAGQLRASLGTGHERMRELGSYAVVYLLDGEGEFADGHGRRQQVTAGDLLLLFPEVPHEYGPKPGGEWNEIYFIFSGPVFDEWRREGLLDPAEPVWHAEPVAMWYRRFLTVCVEPRTGGSASLLEMARLLGVLADMREAWRPSGTHGHENSPDWLESVCRELGQVNAPPDLRRLAAMAGLSYERFRKRFAELVGVPPARYRMLRLVDQASVLLTEDDRPLRNIASDLGFCDEFYFSKVFKQHTGLSPSVYRQQMGR